MAWDIKNTRVWWKPASWWRPWEYEWVVSSYGAFVGSAWTKRGAEKALLTGQAEMMAG